MATVQRLLLCLKNVQVMKLSWFMIWLFSMRASHGAPRSYLEKPCSWQDPAVLTACASGQAPHVHEDALLGDREALGFCSQDSMKFFLLEEADTGENILFPQRKHWKEFY